MVLSSSDRVPHLLVGDMNSFADLVVGADPDLT